MKWPIIARSMCILTVLLAGGGCTKTVMVPVSSCPVPPVITMPVLEVSRLPKKPMTPGALKAMMSGSGPTVFGIFDDRAKMREAAEVLKQSHLAKTVFATQIYNRKDHA